MGHALCTMLVTSPTRAAYSASPRPRFGLWLSVSMIRSLDLASSSMTTPLEARAFISRAVGLEPSPRRLIQMTTSTSSRSENSLTRWVPKLPVAPVIKMHCLTSPWAMTESAAGPVGASNPALYFCM